MDIKILHDINDDYVITNNTLSTVLLSPVLLSVDKFNGVSFEIKSTDIPIYPSDSHTLQIEVDGIYRFVIGSSYYYTMSLKNLEAVIREGALKYKNSNPCDDCEDDCKSVTALAIFYNFMLHLPKGFEPDTLFDADPYTDLIDDFKKLNLILQRATKYLK